MAQTLYDILQDEMKFTRAAKEAFKSVDADGSGEIDLNELNTIMAQIADDMGVPAPSKQDVQEVLMKLTPIDPEKLTLMNLKRFLEISSNLWLMNKLIYYIYLDD